MPRTVRIILPGNSLSILFRSLQIEDIDDVGLGIDAVTPDMLHDHRLGEHAVGIAKQVLEQ